MRKGTYRPIVDSVVIAAIAYLFHKTALHLFMSAAEATFYYPIEILYAFFGFASILILLLLIRIRQSNINNVGYTFMLLTSVKMVAAYLVLRPALASGSLFALTEKLNFLFIFLLFLGIETYVTIRLLNK